MITIFRNDRRGVQFRVTDLSWHYNPSRIYFLSPSTLPVHFQSHNYTECWRAGIILNSHCVTAAVGEIVFHHHHRRHHVMNYKFPAPVSPLYEYQHQQATRRRGFPSGSSQPFRKFQLLIDCISCDCFPGKRENDCFIAFDGDGLLRNLIEQWRGSDVLCTRQEYLIARMTI